MPKNNRTKLCILFFFFWGGGGGSNLYWLFLFWNTVVKVLTQPWAIPLTTNQIHAMHCECQLHVTIDQTLSAPFLVLAAATFPSFARETHWKLENRVRTNVPVFHLGLGAWGRRNAPKVKFSILGNVIGCCDPPCHALMLCHVDRWKTQDRFLVQDNYQHSSSGGRLHQPAQQCLSVRGLYQWHPRVLPMARQELNAQTAKFSLLRMWTDHHGDQPQQALDLVPCHVHHDKQPRYHLQVQVWHSHLLLGPLTPLTARQKRALNRTLHYCHAVQHSLSHDVHSGHLTTNSQREFQPQPWQRAHLSAAFDDVDLRSYQPSGVHWKQLLTAGLLPRPLFHDPELPEHAVVLAHRLFSTVARSRFLQFESPFVRRCCH